MRQILAFTRKEIEQWVQRPGSWIIVFVVPFIFIWIMQAVFGSGTPVVTIYAVNEDTSAQSKRVMEALRGAEALRVVELETREEADQKVGAGSLMAAVIVPAGFGQAVSTAEGARIEVIIDPARSEQANIVTGLVSSALGSTMVDAEVSRGVETSIDQVMKSLPASNSINGQNGQSNPDGLKKFFSAALKGVVSSAVEDALNNPLVSISPESIEQEGQKAARQPSLLDGLVPGYSLMFVFFLISNLAVTVIEERESGTLNRLLVAPVTRSSILLGKMLPYFLIAVAQFVTVLVVSRFVFGIDLGDSALPLGMIIIASSLAMVSLGILVAAFAHSEGQASGVAIILVLVMAVVGGSMFPSISIPGLKLITPHYWAMQGFLNVIARGQGAEGVLQPAGVLFTMSAVFFTIGAIRFRFE
jgi:ABC-2 type transport system permease protein